jgi:chemotaxis signal transduction protein
MDPFHRTGTNDTRIVIVRKGRVNIGMMVDVVFEVLTNDGAGIEPISPLFSTVDIAFFT